MTVSGHAHHEQPYLRMKTISHNSILPTPMNGRKRRPLPPSGDSLRSSACSLTFVRLLAALVSLAIGLSGAAAATAPVTVDPTFHPPPRDGYLNFAYSLPGGEALLGGMFEQIGGLPRSYLARLKSDGALDPAFRANLTWTPFSSDDPVYEAVRQPDGRLLIRGDFNAVDGQPRRWLARLNEDGSLDTSFQPGTGPGGTDRSIYALSLQSDGKILVGGTFTSFNGVSRNRIVRLEPNGTVDLTFNPGTGVGGTDAYILGIAVATNGQILVTGKFSSFAGAARSGVARLNANGSLDATYLPSVRAESTPLVQGFLQTNGQLLLRGVFTNVNGFPRHNLARLEADGSLDANFAPTLVPGSFLAAFPLNDGSVIAAGTLKFADGNQRLLARFLSDGSRDPFFLPPDQTVSASYANAAPGPSGQVHVWGDFIQIGDRFCPGLARIFTDSVGLRSVEFAAANHFTTESNASTVVTLRRHGDVQSALTFRFSTANGTAQAGADYVPQSAIVTFAAGEEEKSIPLSLTDDGVAEPDETVRLQLSDASDPEVILGSENLLVIDDDRPGSLNLNFRADYGTNRFAIGFELRDAATQPDGRALVQVGGYADDGSRQDALVRLHPNGSLDPAFRAEVIGRPMALLPDGSALVGVFENSSIHRVVRLTPSGAVDPSFLVEVDYPGVSAYAIVGLTPLPNGHWLVFGQFTRVNRAARNHIARVDSTGNVDAAFDAGTGPNRWITAATVAPDGQILIAGEFVTVNGVSRRGVARLQTSGALDPTFNPGTGMAPLYDSTATHGVHALAIQPDGRVILVGQHFTSFDGVPMTNCVRLNTNGSVDRPYQVGNRLPGASISTAAIQADGKLLLGGRFRQCDGQPCGHLLMRFLSDGSRDTAFDPGPVSDGILGGLALLNDRDALVWGYFRQFGEAPQAGIARVRLGATAPLHIAGSRTGSFLEITAQGEPGTRWQLERATDLSAPTAWQPLTNITLGASPTVILQPLDAASAFFRGTWRP